MLEWIRCYLTKRRVERREWISRFKGELLPKAFGKLEAYKKESNSCIAEWHGEMKMKF